MIVTIPALAAHEGIYLVTLEISDNCPKCGRPRGKKYGTHSYDGSRRMNCDGWKNPCGHTDKYADVREEGVKVQFVEPCQYNCDENGNPIDLYPDLMEAWA